MENDVPQVLNIQMESDEMNLVRFAAQSVGLSTESFARATIISYCLGRVDQRYDAGDDAGPSSVVYDQSWDRLEPIVNDDDDPEQPVDDEPWRPRPDRG